MRAYIDLHIHSALSPCANNDMTPNNIVNMSKLNGLDIIAITDHNSVENCEAVLKCAQKVGITAIPGMELETSEEVHLICLFKDLEEAYFMQQIVYNALPALENRPQIFGEQLIFDENDTIVAENKRLLLTATNIKINEVYNIMAKFRGVVIPAHVDRQCYSIISNLGSIPKELPISYLEYSKNCKLKEFIKKNPKLEEYKYIRSSDAHNLSDILEREFWVYIDKPYNDSLVDRLSDFYR